MTAERESMTLQEMDAPALGVEERRDEAPGAGASHARPTPDPEVVATDARAIGFGDLYRDGAHAAAGPVDQHALSRLDLCATPKIVQGDESRRRNGGGLFETDAGRLDRQRVLWSGGVLGEGAAIHPLKGTSKNSPFSGVVDLESG